MSASRQTRRDLIKRGGTIGAAAAIGGSLLSSPATHAAAQDGGGKVKFMARGDEAIFAVFQKLKEAFAAVEPDIEVEIEEVPGDWYQKFQLKLASGSPPDCVFEAADTVTASVRAGALAPLDDYLANDDRFIKENFLEIAWASTTYEGKTYGLPYDGGSVALFYNIDLLNAAGVPLPDPTTPITFDQVVEFGKLLTLDRDGRNANDPDFDGDKIAQYGVDLSATSFLIQPWSSVWSKGGEGITADGQVPLDDPVAIEAGQWLADLNLVHHIAPGPQIASETISFLTGNVAMRIDGVWSCVRYRDTDFNWDVAPIPVADVPVSTGWYSPLALVEGGENKDGAWKWISFCCSEPGQTIVAGLGQAVPPVRAIAESEVFLDPSTKPEHKQVFLDQLNPETYRSPGDTMGSFFGGYCHEWGDTYSPIWEEALRGDKSVSDAFTELAPKLEEVLKTGKVQ
jgi:multiple sugar transport system substrate-binding protein